MPQKKIKKTSKVTLTMKLLAMNAADLKQAIIKDTRPCYPADQPSKPVQIEGAFNLARRRHTFVRAGTGSDALGDNQVQEKIAQEFTAMNLKQTNFNNRVAGEILRGKYNFIYLSPEIFLNNEMFTGVYHNQKFPDHLVLIVVDEAHMIYSWGLVSNRKARQSRAHKRHQDRAIFWPSSGDLGRLRCLTFGGGDNWVYAAE
ncbi:hypothetical protein MJO28_014822 [Puccinia striiformis f. sp. tritici]|uniref:Uncharacterized protein n=1 Tax=Puccinia striiformis f. sp. tritici TaxID=168172 RepID=A0ACC0DR18_9BASI|nr:hypothetical protein MJO28_014822 [Puccinia striiformis f. sp. tritici]